jgi:hypothetical protein
VASLRQKQSLLVKCLEQLFRYAHSQGYEFTLGDAGSPPARRVRLPDGRVDICTDLEHMDGSLHYSRLAIDLNLFVNGRYVTSSSSPAWKELGLFWESLDPDCSWGGRFSDANHFSIAHGGKR